jgi:hypothetical protein
VIQLWCVEERSRCRCRSYQEDEIEQARFDSKMSRSVCLAKKLTRLVFVYHVIFKHSS